MSRSTLIIIGITVSSLACGPRDPRVEPPGVVERDWEALCGERCAGPPVQVRVGNGYSCVRYAGGAVLCWGIRRGVEADGDVRRHEGGAIGVPGETQWPQIEMPEGIVEATDLGADESTTCVLEGPARELRCWGTTTPTSLVPRSTWGLDSIAFLTSGGVGSQGHCGVLDDGTPFGVMTEWTAPIRACAPGRCLVDEMGELYCWGLDRRGEIGTGEVGVGGYPHLVEELRDVVEVFARETYTCALESAGDMYCWGDNLYGVIGREPLGRDDEGASYKFPSPQRIEALEDVTRIAGSRVTVCALERTGQLYCWGDDRSGVMRLPPVQAGVSPDTATPVPIEDASDIVDFDLHTNHGCLIRRSGEVACWGSDFHGAIGPEPSHVPFGHLQVVRGLPSH